MLSLLPGGWRAATVSHVGGATVAFGRPVPTSPTLVSSSGRCGQSAPADYDRSKGAALAGVFGLLTWAFPLQRPQQAGSARSRRVVAQQHRDEHERATAFQTGKSDAQECIPAMKQDISLETAMSVDLRVGEVVAASEVAAEVEVEHNGVLRKRKKRFLKLNLDIGTEVRTIVSDLLLTLDAESAVGKSLIIIANVPPEQVAGHGSHGRILLGENYDPGPMPSTFRKQLPEPAQLPSGAAITLV